MMKNSKMAVGVLTETRVPEALIAMVKNALHAKNISHSIVAYEEGEERIIKEFQDKKAILCCPGRYISCSAMQRLNETKLFQLWSSGYDKFNLAGAKKSGIQVCNNGGANASSVAEHTILLILSGLRNVDDGFMRVASGTWAGNDHGLSARTLRSVTVGIIGAGAIGSKVARLCKSFGANVIYNDLSPMADLEKQNISYATLNELVSTSDVISLHLHLNKSTLGIFDKNLIKKMKQNSILVNVSRAQLVDFDFLRKNTGTLKIKRVLTDVYEMEPNDPGDILLTEKIMLGTPHTAGSTFDTYQEAIDRCAENIKMFLTTGKFNYKVNS